MRARGKCRVRSLKKNLGQEEIKKAHKPTKRRVAVITESQGTMQVFCVQNQRSRARAVCVCVCVRARARARACACVCTHFF